jgi:molybdate transport system substrate-binding protein
VVSLALVAALALAAAGDDGDGGGRLTVLAAASLTEALPVVAPDARYSFGGSSQLALQLREGAPVDVFASASPALTQALHRDGIVERPESFAHNELVVIVPAGGGGDIDDVRDLAGPGVRLVVAAPTVPAGAYTAEALRRLGLVGLLARVVSREPDVKGVVGKVALGEADAGIVYATDAQAAGDRVRTVPIPEEGQPDIRYEVAVVATSTRKAAARAFVQALLGPEGRAALVDAGFTVPTR